MCNIEDAEASTFHRQVTRIARKEHSCYECGRTIRLGESYSDEAAMWDFTVETMRICPQCVAARGWLSDECGGYVFGTVFEELREHFDQGHKEIGRLVVAMRNDWERVLSADRYTVEDVARMAGS